MNFITFNDYETLFFISILVYMFYNYSSSIFYVIFIFEFKYDIKIALSNDMRNFELIITKMEEKTLKVRRLLAFSSNYMLDYLLVILIRFTISKADAIKHTMPN